MQEFIAKNGQTYFIDLDEGENVCVYDNDKNVVGDMTFLHVNADDWKTPNSDYFHLQNLNLEQCKRLGIGTEIMRLHIECFERPITAASAFGPRMDDGSHLINDGIPFVQKMRELGLICSDEEDFDEDV